MTSYDCNILFHILFTLSGYDWEVAIQQQWEKHGMIPCLVVPLVVYIIISATSGDSSVCLKSNGCGTPKSFMHVQKKKKKK